MGAWRGLASTLALHLLGVQGSSPYADELKTFVGARGYPFEEHDATTSDGVRLALFRIPQPGAPAVNLQHGLLDSAWAWVYNPEFKALGFALHDAGYDVWLGNNRGNTFSTDWANGTSAREDPAFWNYTFEDMAYKGVPAILDTITAVTGQKKVAWIGHSQGTMQFIISGSTPALKASVADRVSLFIGLSPVAWLTNCFGPLRWLAESPVEELGLKLFRTGFMQRDSWRDVAKVLCHAAFGVFCHVTMGALFGQSDFDSTAVVEGYVEHFPAGTSWKDVVHLFQNVRSGRFQRYDYGASENMKVYGSATPPEYTPELMAVPSAFFIATADTLSDPKDMDRLISVLKPGGQLVATRTYPGFSHATWEMGKQEAGYYIADVVSVLHERHPVNSADGLVV